MWKGIPLLLAGFLSAAPALEENADTAWVRRYNGTGNGQDVSDALAVDSAGNTYVTGRSIGSGTNTDYATIKYYPNGDTAWLRRYGATSDDFEDNPWDIAVDVYGNVFVTGQGFVPGSDFDAATIKYYPTGETAWVRTYDGPINSVDGGIVLAIDGLGNIFVTGDSYGDGIGFDYVTLKYYPSGDTAWIRRYNGVADGHDYGRAMAIDSHANVFASGTSYDEIQQDWDYATVKYDSSGNRLWVARYNGTGNGYDWVQAMVTDEHGNVYVTGYSFGDGTDYDWATVKYDSVGNERWVARYNGPGNGSDWANAIALAGPDLVVTGSSKCVDGTDDYTTIKYDSLGNEIWVRQYNGTGNGSDQAVALAVDSSGGIYVTGTSYGTANAYDIATVKYDSDGNEKWAKRYDGPAQHNDGARALSLDNLGSIYVTGWSVGIGTDADFVTIKYVQWYCGDANGDVATDISDVVYLIAYIFSGGSAPSPLLAGDANCDSTVDISDAVYLIAYIFSGGQAPCEACK
jgi:hypothetical protein